MPYIGVSPQFGVRRKHTYTATAGQTSFSGAGSEGATLSYTDSNFVDVYQNGVKLGDADYTSTSGTAIVLAQGASVDDLIEIIVFDAFSAADTVSKADGGTFDGAVTFAGGVSGVLDADDGITVDNITIDGTEIDLSSGDLTIDSAGDIILDAVDSITTPTAGTANVKLGNNAGNSIASGGIRNVTVGDEAGTAITTGTRNVAVGYQALATEDTGSRSIAIGHQALTTQNGGTSDLYNVGVGHNAGGAITTGNQNTLIGGLSGDAMTSAVDNVAVGYLSMSALTDADYNVAVGKGALSDDTQGSKSTAVGYQALSTQNFTSATDANNTAVGYNAGSLLTTGEQNVFIGALAGDACTDDDHNTFVGYNAGGAVNGGFRNTFIGKSAGDAVTTGDKNIIIGTYNGNESSLDIRTSSNNVVLSDGDGNVAAYRTGGSNARSWYLIGDANSNVGLFIRNIASTNPYGVAIQFTNAANNTTSQYFLVCTDSSASRFLIYANGNVVNTNNSYGQYSDQKLKENITDATSQWNDIKSLKVRKFNFKGDDLTQIGVVAQELESAGMNGLVEEITDRDEDMKDLGTTTKSVKYSVLYMKAVKALQEAMTRIETLEAKVTALENAE